MTEANVGDPVRTKATPGTHRHTNCWDLSGRDVVPDLNVMGSPSDVGAQLLYALLDSDGLPWKAPYAEVRAKAGIRRKAIEPEREEQANQRLRTYFALFRGLGLVLDENGTIRVTQLGRRIRHELTERFQTVDAYAADTSPVLRRRLARLVIGGLARYQLRNPTTADLYPPGTDIHPLWAIWKTMRGLDNKVHWEEVTRVLTTCLRMADVDGAIAKIREARNADDYDSNNLASLDKHLGPRQPDLGDHDDQRDRTIVWLSRAGFKDIFIELRNRPDGYRYLQEEFLPLLDEVLEEPPVWRDFATADEYYAWLGSAPALGRPEDAQGPDDAIREHVLTQCRRYGDRFIIALVGPAGVGKTRMAYEAALILADQNHDRVEPIQFHAAFTYEEFVGGLAPTPTGGFQPEPGILLRINDKALAHRDSLYVLLIDELSRADVANVLGELLTYVEYRDRSFRVAALDREVQLARNLVILATLNERDRSVINLDDAAVRRIRFVDVPRSVDALRRILDESGMAANLRDEVVEWFDQLPPDAPFGHGVFVGVRDEKDLHHLWQEQLRFFLRRGDITTYPDPGRIERGFRWRHPGQETEDESTAETAAPGEIVISETPPQTVATEE